MHILPALMLAGLLDSRLAQAAEPASPIGRWLTGRDGGVVEIARCGAALCGRIVGITPGQSGDAVPRDSQGRPECGLGIITDAGKTGANEWTGSILDPRNGKTYHARLSLDSAGRLNVRAYIGLALFGETVVWTPFDGRIGANCRIVDAGTREARPPQ